MEVVDLLCLGWLWWQSFSWFCFCFSDIFGIHLLHIDTFTWLTRLRRDQLATICYWRLPSQWVMNVSWCVSVTNLQTGQADLSISCSCQQGRAQWQAVQLSPGKLFPVCVGGQLLRPLIRLAGGSLDTGMLSSQYCSHLCAFQSDTGAVPFAAVMKGS